MRRSVLVVLCVAGSLTALRGAAAAPYAAKAPMISSDGAFPKCLALDPDGGRYVAGSLFGTADFDPGKAAQQRTSAGVNDVFVTKYDAKGAWKWTRTFGGTGDDQPEAIVVGGSTVYVVGKLQSVDARFGGAGPVIESPSGGPSGFVLALDAATGAPRTSFGGTGAATFANAHATAVAFSGVALYVGGIFGGTGFGFGADGATRASSGGIDGFVAALDAAGGAPLASFGAGGVQTFGGSLTDAVVALAASEGRIYVAGHFGSADFGFGGTGALATTSPFFADAFVAALDAGTGAPATSFGGDGAVVFGSATGTESAVSLAVSGGTVYAAGLFDGPDARLDGAGAPAPVVGALDVFLLALDAAGARVPQFAGGVQVFGSPAGDDRPDRLLATPTGVYLDGALGGPDAGIGGRGAVEDADGFVLALDPTTGGPLAGFGDDGVRTFVGATTDDGPAAIFVRGFATNARGELALAGGTSRGGAYDGTEFPAAGNFLVSVDPATGLPLNMGLNRRPAFDSPPIPSANPVVQGRPVSFRVASSDPDRDKLVFQWDWGDGGFAGGKAPKKTWKIPGTYHVRATVADGRGGTTQSEVMDVLVVPRDIPFFDVSKLTVSLRFSKSGADQIVVAGQVPASDGVPLFTKIFKIKVGLVSADFVIDSDNRSNSGDATLAVKPASRGVAQFVVKMKGNYAALLAPLGMTDDTKTNAYAAVPVHVEFFGGIYDETVPLLYSAKAGASGSAK